ncbi:lysoplasmalogenase [Acidaminobacter sp. JC074]|uniref:lysoplasmalogenase n=1 Tax=Acidaminobacter sp. JC074 TaxID=2530199 RepID=UPI001F10F4F9|nr:lysoplasmalogenase [Acidaminobacter sp. JC074]MCH4888024.1 lysoplasmalogenase [Acidaminobacter sp. JC074]
MKYLFLSLFLIISLINVFTQNKRFSPIYKRITKPLIIPFLILFYMQTETYNNLLVMALLFGWIGDVLIIFHHYLKDGQTYKIYPIISGLAAFLIGHVFYIFLFKDNVVFSPLILAYIIVYIATNISLFKIGLLKSESSLLKTSQKKLLKTAILLYSFVILTMSYFSFYVNATVFLGSLSFLVSDTILSLKEFGQVKLPEEMVMITYILAQFLIVLGNI